MMPSLLEFARKFSKGDISADEFVEVYASEWKRQRDSGDLIKYEPKLSEILSTIFCLVDLYNSSDDRENYELDASGLRIRVERVMGDAS